MTKPDWLIEQERKKNRPDPITCASCAYFYGNFVGYARYKDKTNCEIRECEIHEGCHNTIFSVRCEDYIKAMV